MRGINFFIITTWIFVILTFISVRTIEKELDKHNKMMMCGISCIGRSLDELEARY